MGTKVGVASALPEVGVGLTSAGSGVSVGTGASSVGGRGEVGVSEGDWKKESTISEDSSQARSRARANRGAREARTRILRLILLHGQALPVCMYSSMANGLVVARTSCSSRSSHLWQLSGHCAWPLGTNGLGACKSVAYL